MQRGPVGLMNKTSDKAIWINCPIRTHLLYDSPAAVAVYARFVNTGNRHVNGTCVSREIGLGGGVIIARNFNFSIPPKTQKVVGGEGWLKNPYNNVTVQCKLPPKTKMIHYGVQTVQ